ncbi:MAG: TIGR03960 family B12-binding radical SAM protein, partial [Spirochaetes bacterium]|nr:TIGR03960 family B12-binding radical SAM protein [Spirochaetota bacterium]
MDKINKKLIEKLVFNVQKPARYTGGELNQIIKPDPFIKMAVCYPDLYEIGMSNNGIKILYDIANSIADVRCERVFAVDLDFEVKLKESGIPLYTLETYTPLSKLDIIGFNLSHELLYTNILQVIELGGNPLYRGERDENHPIIIAGGSAASNPLPVSDFIDAFFLGDGEEGIVDIINSVRISKNNSCSRMDTLRNLQKIEGVYVPAVYTKNNSGESKIKKRVFRKKEFKDPLNPIIPNIRITQERMNLEVARGCKNLCKFCHAGYYDLPYRRSTPEAVRDRLFEMIKTAPYTDLTLSSLSINDYKGLVKLLNYVLPPLIEKGISISLPSLKVDMETLPVIEKVSDLRRTSLTFAVESACDEIRELANKNLLIEDMLSIAEFVFSRGWKLIKLYFMLGLPGCEEHDEVEPIIKLLKKLERLGGKKRNINVTLSPFVPKPHTPFQNEKQMPADYFFSSIMKIKKALPRTVAIKAHDVRSSVLEGVMARGDESLGAVIHSSYIDGCRLDSWSEHFKYAVWEKNLNLHIPGWEKFLGRKDEPEEYPWSFIVTGFERLLKKQKSSTACVKINKTNDADEEISREAIDSAVKIFEKKYGVRSRVRLTFTKTDMARFIPHLDFIEIVKRALRMSSVPVSYSQGFNKRERLSFGHPLPLGIESICELCDADLHDDYEASLIKNNLKKYLPAGIDIIDAKISPGGKSLMSVVSIIEYEISVYD